MPRPCRIALLLLVSACEPRAALDYFPLQAGLEWHYQIHKTILNKGFTQRAIIRSVPAEIVDDKTRYPQVSANGKRYHFFTDKDGLYRLRPDGKTQIRVLKYPLQPGTAWTVPTRLFLFDLPRQLADDMRKISRDMTMDYKISSMEDALATPAGRFYDCMRIDGIGFADIPKHLMLGIRTVKAEETQWYCPGAGLVKQVRKEYALPAQYPTEYTQELIGFERL